jgi:hypothetical protein
LVQEPADTSETALIFTAPRYFTREKPEGNPEEQLCGTSEDQQANIDL